MACGPTSSTIANCAVQALNDGDTLTDTFTVTTIDGTEQVVTITIHGANDADPNDFDHLATGRHIVSDPPHIFGTRGDDTIDGLRPPRSDYFHAAPVTTPSARPANVTSSTQGPAMTWSRAMTGTTRSTGAREGIRSTEATGAIPSSVDMARTTSQAAKETIVSFSCRQPTPTRPSFDVITDFKSGSDRIDLTALGAFAFLALTSASTSVPAHTVAWLYDSAANQTILYVNPTDHILDIGDSALLEVHLEGLVTVQASDFVPEPTAAPVMVAAEPGNPELTATAETDAAVVATVADASLDGTDSHNAHARRRKLDVANGLEGRRLRLLPP